MSPQPTDEQIERARALLNSFGLHPRTCGPTRARAIQDKLAQALAAEAQRVEQRVRMEERERCARVAETEGYSVIDLCEPMGPFTRQDKATASCIANIASAIRAQQEEPGNV